MVAQPVTYPPALGTTPASISRCCLFTEGIHASAVALAVAVSLAPTPPTLPALTPSTSIAVAILEVLPQPLALRTPLLYRVRRVHALFESASKAQGFFFIEPNTSKQKQNMMKADKKLGREGSRKN